VNIQFNEPVNPIKIIKDEIVYSPSNFLKLPLPFKFICNNICLEINRNDAPKYFKRKTFRITNGIPTIFIKYYIGKESEDGKLVYFWIDVNGKIIEEK
jgi:hypothetical protein